jgi:Flp pilus assembly protein protease CpaA
VDVYKPLYFWLHPAASVSDWLIIALMALVVVASIVCAVTDLRSMIIPNVITYPLIAIFLIAAPFLWQDWITHLVAGATCAILFGGAAFIKIRGQYAMGMGDVKLYTVAGLVLGLGALPCVVVASLTGAVLGIAVLRSGALNKQIPHGPHIAFGIVLMVAVGLMGWLG